MPKLKLVSNVAEFGLFQSLAKTRNRLILSTVLATAVCLGAGFASAHHVLEVSNSVGLNMLLIAINMCLVMVAAYMQAMLIGDIFFSGPWREQIILGQRNFDDPDAEVAVQNHNAEFMILILMLIVGNAIGLNIATGGFLDVYHTEGFFRVKMRSEEVKERTRALKDMVEPTQFDLWPMPGVQKVVLDALSDSASTVRAQAAWNAGQMKVESASSKLITLLKKDDSAIVRAEAGTALGRLGQHAHTRDALEQQLKLDTQPAVLVGIIRGLGLMADPESNQALIAMTKHKDKQVWLHAFWALRKIKAPETRIFVKKQLEKPVQDKIKHCALLDTFKMVSKPDDVLWARKQFLRTEKDTKCDPVIWEDRNEYKRYILYYDRHRTKYIKIIANSGGALEQKSWFRRIASDPSEPWPVRDIAGQVLKQLK